MARFGAMIRARWPKRQAGRVAVAAEEPAEAFFGDESVRVPFPCAWDCGYRRAPRRPPSHAQGNAIGCHAGPRCIGIVAIAPSVPSTTPIAPTTIACRIGDRGAAAL
jgi:hypothetical protein